VGGGGGVSPPTPPGGGGGGGPTQLAQNGTDAGLQPRIDARDVAVGS